MARFVDTLIQDGLDWPIEVIVDPVEPDLVDIRHRRLCHHWRVAQRARQALPMRSDLSPAFLAEITDHLVVTRNGDDPYYEHYGRALARAYGRDMTGKSASDFPASIGQMFRSIYRLCELNRAPVFACHTPPPSVPIEHWLRLVVPLGDAGGHQVTHFLVCSIPVGGTTP
jgi:hypothetical protein